MASQTHRELPEIMLERYLADDLPVDKRAMVEALCAESSELTERLESMRRLRQAFYAADPPGAFAHRISVRLAHEAEAAPKKGFARWVWFAGPSAAAAMTVLLMVTIGQKAEQPVEASGALSGAPRAAAQPPSQPIATPAPVGEVGGVASLTEPPAVAATPDHFKDGQPTTPPKVRRQRPRLESAPKYKAFRPGKGESSARASGRKSGVVGPSPEGSSLGYGGAASSRAASRARSAAPLSQAPKPRLQRRVKKEAAAASLQLRDLGEPSPAAEDSAGAGARGLAAEPEAEVAPAPTTTTKALRQDRDATQQGVLASVILQRQTMARDVSGRRKWIAVGKDIDPGSVARVAVRLQRAGHLLIIGRRSSGKTTLYLPRSGNRSHKIAAGNVASSAVELRGHGLERIYVLFSDRPLTVGSVMEGVTGAPKRLPFVGEQRVLSVRILADDSAGPAATGTHE